VVELGSASDGYGIEPQAARKAALAASSDRGAPMPNDGIGSGTVML
jgi:hypothetical protein